MVQLVDSVFAIESPGNSGLICEDDDKVTGLDGHPDRVNGTRYPCEIFWLMDVTTIFIQYAIPV